MLYAPRKSRISQRIAGLVLIPAILVLVALEAAPVLTPVDLVRVVDGDTIIVMLDGTEERIRYIGIDTPEMNLRSPNPPEPGAELASLANEVILADRPILIELDAQERDRYGRILAYVWIEFEGERLMVNEILIRLGLAVPLTIPPNVKYVDRFKKAQEKAREEKLKLWSE